MGWYLDTPKTIAPFMRDLRRVPPMEIRYAKAAVKVINGMDRPTKRVSETPWNGCPKGM